MDVYVFYLYILKKNRKTGHKHKVKIEAVLGVNTRYAQAKLKLLTINDVIFIFRH